MDYKTAGVDIEAGYKSVELMKEHVKRTMREEVLGGLGGFSGAFSLAKIKEMEEPVLLSGTDVCGEIFSGSRKRTYGAVGKESADRIGRTYPEFGMDG